MKQWIREYIEDHVEALWYALVGERTIETPRGGRTEQRQYKKNGTDVTEVKIYYNEILQARVVWGIDTQGNKSVYMSIQDKEVAEKARESLKDAKHRSWQKYDLPREYLRKRIDRRRAAIKTITRE